MYCDLRSARRLGPWSIALDNGCVSRAREDLASAGARKCLNAKLRCIIYSMIITRKVRKVGNSLMIPLPPETLSESGFKEGMEVAIGSRPGHVDLDPAGIPDNWLVEFTARFTERYREDLAELADL